MSKINPELLTETIKEIIMLATDEKPRKFVETIELQIGLKNFDPSRDKRINGSVRLPFQPKRSCKVCLFGNQKHIDEAKAIGLDCQSHDELKLLKKQKKPVKKLAKSYDAFLASANLIKQVPRLVGPILNKIGKFPTAVPTSGVDPVKSKLEEIKCTVKFSLKFKVGMPMSLSCAIGHMEMTPEQIEENMTVAINYLLSLMKKGWQNIRRIHIKTTMGPSRKIYGL